MASVSKFAQLVVETMKNHPELLSKSLIFLPRLSLLTLQCIDETGHQRQLSGSPASPVSSVFPILSEVSSNLSAITFASDVTVISPYAPDEYERTTYYNGITGNNSDHPVLVYRSNFLTTLFPKPEGGFAYIPVKSVHQGADQINWLSIDPARFFTHGPPGEEEKKGTLGPVVIWVGVIPGSTSSDTAHEVSQEIPALLLKNGVGDAVVEWREAVPARLVGPPLMPHVGSHDATYYVRRFLTALLGISLATEGMKFEDAQGTLTLWFHKNKDEDGNPSSNVYGVSNCHVLRKDTTVKYEHKGGAAKFHVRVCGMRRFQRGIDEIRKAIGDQGTLADLWTREIVKLRAKEKQDAKAIRANQRNLDDANEAIADLEALYDEVRGTGPTLNSTATSATLDTLHPSRSTSKAEHGSKYTPQELTALFYPLDGGPTTFMFPEERKLRIEGCATREELANPEEFDAEGQRCFIVGKYGNTTDLTVGRYAGLVSFLLNEVGIESVELGIYNSGVKNDEGFSAKGDSGSLVWHAKRGKARIVGQLHSGSNKGGATTNHVTYCSPGWYFLDQVRKKFKHADFYRFT
ncbi:hypothetical protein FRB99_002198 [Tulasnella sp. 403]|nr:hypothetical protein FRB99_002198 [Tulasnella sp. 403]